MKSIKDYSKYIFTICFSFTKNYFDAEDLTQETFIAAQINLKNFDGCNMKGWLTRIAANKCKDHLKSSAKKHRSTDPEELKAIVDESYSPLSELMKKTSREGVEALCNKLKEPYKTISIKYFCEGIKLSEQAKASDKNLRTLETQLYRAKSMLRELWKEECEYG